MAYRQILRRNLLLRPQILPKNAHASFSLRTQNKFFSSSLTYGSVTKRTPFASSTFSSRSTPFFWKAAGIAGVGLGASVLLKPEIRCESPQATPVTTPNANGSLPLPPGSNLNVYELSFGTVCGICAGVFVKKGAKVVAFFLGGAFVLLQYLGSASLVRIDWNRAATRFENLFYRTDPVTGARRAPTIYSLFNWLATFLMTDFQPRASFLAGLMLGLRIG